MFALDLYAPITMAVFCRVFSAMRIDQDILMQTSLRMWDERRLDFHM